MRVFRAAEAAARSACAPAFAAGARGASRVLCASLPDRPCLVDHCARTSTRSVPGCGRAAPTPGSPTSSRSASATSSSSSARTSSSATRTPRTGRASPDYPEEIDLRAEDDALIAAELEAAEAEAERARPEATTATRRKGTTRRQALRAPGAAVAAAGEDGAQAPRAHRPAGGHLRPRRGGLRAVARPGHPGQPDLRRALGRAPAGRGDGRGGPHRHPPRRRGRLGPDLPAAAGVVGGLAQVAPERRVDHDAGLPRPGILGRHLHRHLQAPGGAAFIELDELLRGEAPAERLRSSATRASVTRSAVGRARPVAAWNGAPPCCHW